MRILGPTVLFWRFALLQKFAVWTSAHQTLEPIESDESDEPREPRERATLLAKSRVQATVRQGSGFDHVTQCSGGVTHHPLDFNPSAPNLTASATCSANQPGATAPLGTCICGEGSCADKDGNCHRGSYLMINDVFTITAKAYGATEKLYMSPDGKVKVGNPPDPAAAQWRIAVTRDGAKILWSDAYTNTILQEYQSCASTTDSYGLSHTLCQRVVGHVPDPNAADMGWRIELYGDAPHDPLRQFRKSGDDIYVQLRSIETANMLFISPLTKEGLACEARGRNCPGDAGAFRFDPPLVPRTDIVLDSPGGMPTALSTYMGTCIMAFILACCMGCVYGALPNSEQGAISKMVRGMSGCILIPCIQFSQVFGLTKHHRGERMTRMHQKGYHFGHIT